MPVTHGNAHPIDTSDCSKSRDGHNSHRRIYFIQFYALVVFFSVKTDKMAAREMKYNFMFTRAHDAMLFEGSDMKLNLKILQIRFVGNN